MIKNCWNCLHGSYKGCKRNYGNTLCEHFMLDPKDCDICYFRIEHCDGNLGCSFGYKLDAEKCGNFFDYRDSDDFREW